MAIQTVNLTQTSDVPGASRQNQIPLKLYDYINKGTANADECFVNQRFSNELQAFLIGYVGTVTSGVGISATVGSR